MQNFTSFIYLFIILILAVSCSGDIPEESISEQTNLKFEGNLDFLDEQMSLESDPSKDIITYHFDPENPKTITFLIHLINGHTLSVNIFNRNLDKVWETPTNYPIYASQDTSQHWKYCTATYMVSSEAPTYFTHLGTVFPKGTDIDPFEVVSYDNINKQIRCRFRDFILYKNTNSNQNIIINGTFVGAATF